MATWNYLIPGRLNAPLVVVLGHIHPRTDRVCLQIAGWGGIQELHDFLLVRDPAIQPQVIMCRGDDGGHPVMQGLHDLVGRHDDDAATVQGLTVAC